MICCPQKGEFQYGTKKTFENIFLEDSKSSIPCKDDFSVTKVDFPIYG
jgi:hypothetical protein